MSINVAPLQKIKRIALVAHDNRKKDMIIWAKENKEILERHLLYGTGTTSSLLTSECELDVQGFLSGPLGGDQQIGSRIIEGDIDFMIFFWDPMSAQPHDPDVKALLRIAVLYNIPIAMNQSTADFMLRSEYMDQVYDRKLIDYATRIVRKGE